MLFILSKIGGRGGTQICTLWHPKVAHSVSPKSWRELWILSKCLSSGLAHVQSITISHIKPYHVTSLLEILPFLPVAFSMKSRLFCVSKNALQWGCSFQGWSSLCIPHHTWAIVNCFFKGSYWAIVRGILSPRVLWLIPRKTFLFRS